MHTQPISTHEAHIILTTLPSHTSTPSSNSYLNKTSDYLKHCKLTKSQTDDIRSILTPLFSDEQVAVIGSLLPEGVEELKMYVGTGMGDEQLAGVVARMRQVWDGRN